ncbi:MAG: DUF2231 domain-containing protein [Candidatus Eiseniibacteriota bacterium]
MPSLPIHPVIVHTPIALLIFSALFELAGRALDADWWRRAAFTLLLLGTLGAAAAVITGTRAGDAAEHQGVAEQPIDSHEDAGKLTLGLAIGAVVVRLLASRAGTLRGVAGGLALALQLAAAIMVGVAGYRGGRLVYEHGAGVSVHGTRVAADHPPATPSGDHD